MDWSLDIGYGLRSSIVEYFDKDENNVRIRGILCGVRLLIQLHVTDWSTHFQLERQSSESERSGRCDHGSVCTSSLSGFIRENDFAHI